MSEISAHDPAAMRNAERLLPPGVKLCGDPYQVAEGSDALVIATEWEEYLSLDMARLRLSMAGPILVDGRNLFDPAEMAAMGFEYRGFGRSVPVGGTVVATRTNGHVKSLASI